MTTDKRDALILNWREASSKLAALKKTELELRKAIVEKIFDPEQNEGTERIDLGQDWTLKVVKKLSYRVTGKPEQVVAAMSTFSSELQKRLVAWKPSLSTREYKLLDTEQLKAFNEVVLIKPGTPSLELIPPKE